MSAGAPEPFDAGWLALREPVDHASRAGGLEEELVRHLLTRPTGGARDARVRVVDLGAGTGSTLRHLAPRLARLGLAAPQDWTLVDHDDRLLSRALAAPRPPAAATVRTRRADLGDAAALADVLAGADVVTASALLDVLTPATAATLVGALAAVVPRAAVLVALTVTGGAGPRPADARAREVAAAFDADQRAHGLGPDATAHVTALLEPVWRVRAAASPWRLGPAHGELLDAWWRGWTAPALRAAGPGGDLAAWAHARRTDPALRAEVPHRDLLALPV
ncbi:SAM-dependent methyltransferase [Kineococcus sp. R8]|uniref:SAM-dependent methyltransferase n=1 Tax=Kineococcus siccus TaxID=2696567 RepID=UPI00141362C0|nr:SAM-dependent methyltransferase [Kineococcus siccus]NAZ83267.1 SAM-dependent methyltransferase [Kineococcus siccus]